MAKAPTPNPRRGEVWLVDFNPAVGAEIQKVRPALVVNLDSVGTLPLRLVVPMTDWKPHYASRPWVVKLSSTHDNGLRKDSGGQILFSANLYRSIGSIIALVP